MEILNELEKRYEVLKKELNLTVSLKELDKYFFVIDSLLKNNYVPYDLSSLIRYRISEISISYVNFLHSLIVPNPQSMIDLNQSQSLSEEDKEIVNKLIGKLMVLFSKNNVINVDRNKENEAEHINNSIKVYKEIKPELLKIEQKVNKIWEEKED